MSRMCVKNLPKYVVEDRLRELFSHKGEITDVKLMRTKDGRSRQLAFIGFRTDREAQEAIQYFNKSYLDTSKIMCEVAQGLGDTNLPRPWSRYSKKKENEVTTPDANKHARTKGQGDKSKDIVDNNDTQLQDFLQVMQPRTRGKLWANDTSIVSNVGNDQGVSNKDSKGTSDSIHAILVPCGLLVDGHPNYLEPNKSHEIEHDEVISDMDYFKSRVTTEWSDSEKSDCRDDDDDSDIMCIDDDEKDNHTHASEHEENCDNNLFERPLGNGAQGLDLDGQEDTCGKGVTYDKAQVKQEGQSSNPKDEKGVFESCRLFVRNLPYTTTVEELQNHVEEKLQKHFNKLKRVTEVHLIVDKNTKQPKGIAYIRFSDPEFAARALKVLDGSICQGRLLHVMPAIQRPSNNKDNNVSKNEKSQTFKQQREEKRKAAEATGDTKAWNSLFMRRDTIMEYIARKYDVSKSDLLDREAEDLAVRIALGETQVILETKKALTNVGVNVESLEELANVKGDGVKRSNHVLLVKNLPFTSTEKELARMFGKFGSLDKIILPPTKTLALIVFLEQAEAKAAFRGLAYKRYKDAPLYLEWAPSNILSQSSTSKSNEMNNGIGGDVAKRLILEQNIERISDVDIDPDRVEARTLFVKNLNFKTTDECLKKHFSEHMKEGRILSVKVKKYLKNGKYVSSQYGFVEFDSREIATNVCGDLQGTVLDGHILQLHLCRVKNDGQVPMTVEKGYSSTKLLIKNVPFEAAKKDLKDLLCTFGEIKCFRLPRKFGGYRGFAFVEYVTQQETQNALKLLSDIHFHERHLVLLRAKEVESLDELRARTAAQFRKDNEFQNATKLCKKRKLMSLDEGNM